MTQEEIDAIM
nr:hypothetical protein [Tanacetum cinerariifolium]GEY89062.1 hypothetical protein [Tanacetum cinerariifolium]